jgi:hypothetical protein
MTFRSVCKTRREKMEEIAAKIVFVIEFPYLYFQAIRLGDKK